ncbi:MAG: hypothetical protein ACI906_003003 [Candidatus Latescibacterota bacterium]|jgi:hypothetical protein
MTTLRTWLSTTFALSALIAFPLDAQQVRYDSASDWRQWELPLGAVDLLSNGTIIPTEIRKASNAVTDLARFAGGIRNAGSNLADARLVIDNDPTTGWAPDPQADPTEWFLEVDLGRAVSANSVTLVFDADAPPFELFDLLLSTGEPETDFIAAPIAGSLIYRIKERFKENGRHRVTFEFENVDDSLIQYVRFEPLLITPGARLVEVEVEAIGDNISLGLLERGGLIDVNINLDNIESQPLGKASALVDGDLYARWRAGTASRGANDILAHMVLDLGAVYWIDQVRLIGGVVVRSGFGGGITTTHFISRRRWDFRFYEFMTSDGSIAPDGSRIYTKHFSGNSSSNETAKGLVDHHFDLLPTRYVRVFWKFWDTTCSSLFTPGEDTPVGTIPGCAAGGTTDEVQIFGRGFPQQVGFTSPLIDLSQGRNLNSIEWSGDAPAGTRVEIRTRTGNEVVETYTFHDKNGKEVTESRYKKLIPSFRGAVDTSSTPGGDWSPWSNIYGASGAAFQSPSPRRFMEIDVRLVSNSPDAAASLDYLAVNFTPPLARRAIGEITPQQALPGEMTEFTYYLRPEDTIGFDRLAVEATAPVHFVGVALNGAQLDAQSDTTGSGFVVQLPNRISQDQLLELRFRSSVFLQSTRFDVFLQDSRQDESVRQRVDPGDANDLIESSTNVVSLPVSRALLANIEFNSRTITPNGDAINDELKIAIDLVNLLEPRPLRLRIYDLTGRSVYEHSLDSVAGQQEFNWNGTNNDGQRVVPGLYIMEINVQGDSGDESIQQIVSVAY